MAMFALTSWLTEFSLSAISNIFELRCEPKHLMLLYYKICPCYASNIFNMTNFETCKVLLWSTRQYFELNTAKELRIKLVRKFVKIATLPVANHCGKLLCTFSFRKKAKVEKVITKNKVTSPTTTPKKPTSQSTPGKGTPGKKTTKKNQDDHSANAPLSPGGRKLSLGTEPNEFEYEVKLMKSDGASSLMKFQDKNIRFVPSFFHGRNPNSI